MNPVSAVVMHRIPGRVRLRVADRRGDTEYFSGLSEEISGMPGIAAVKVNPGTGSVVITYSGTMDELARRLEERQLAIDNLHEFNADRGNAAPGNGAHAEPFLLVSNRDINPMFMLGALLAAIGIVQTFRGKILIPAASALWYAMQAFRQSQPPAPHPSNGTAGRMEGSRAEGHQGPGGDNLVH